MSSLPHFRSQPSRAKLSKPQVWSPIMYLNQHHRSPSPPPPYSATPLVLQGIENHPRFNRDTATGRARITTELQPRSTLPHLGSLESGKELRSRNGWFRLCMQDDGNLVLYSGTEPIWSSRTHIKGQAPYRLTINEDNQLCIYDASGEVTWASGTSNKGAPGAWAKLRNNGNFVLYDGNGKMNPLWCTGTYGGRKALECYQGSGLKVLSPKNETDPLLNISSELPFNATGNQDTTHHTNGLTKISTGQKNSTLCSGQTLENLQELTSANGKFRLCMQDNGNLVLYSAQEPIWSSRTQNKGQPPFRLVMQQDNQLCIYDSSGSPTWTSQTRAEGATGGWARLRNSGSFVIYDGNGTNNPLWCTRTDDGVKALEVHQGVGYKLL